ncbi:Rieske 2Fe-2S domain-containing protein [uncultured Meiothermus sp.]|jgi:rieske iron-sulfur protein|uniref:QcrA and Rieske domain-containing protein n=1 Tax=uncultured Meiothermus sp. TaxID=157471 RepID=UPI00261D4F00|nr:Rieske 2Fe-2S domain-containing protein [uncultured Meiothermus sp.]
MADHEAKAHHHDHPEDPQAHATRRAVLQAAIGVGAGAAVLSTLWVGAGLVPRVEKVPSKEPVAVGDTLVFAMGAKADQEITLDDLRAAQGAALPFIIAFPKSPENVIKKDLRNNTLMVILADPARMSPETRQHASPEGVLAYSAICKHLGCTVSQWINNNWVCPCHGGVYDIHNQARVLAGPVPAPVPQLPVRVEGGRVVVAGEFLGEPGADV